MDIEERDALTNPGLRHPRARELMTDERLWDVRNDLCPFGSDEVWDSVEEYLHWRDENPRANLKKCIINLLEGEHRRYNRTLLQDDLIQRQIDMEESEDEDPCLGLGYSDSFTLDGMIIATVLSQLIYEGKIDRKAKPFARIAIMRQLHPLTLKDQDHSREDNGTRSEILNSVLDIIEKA